ncbi:chromatin remodeling protein EBS isoform X2 [Cryptomeria japonica]|uniref:chromatin remodeling protein EBS isoform X2 n=1 Tax=Cryptomeria japonica TaxID=3369 RepID=UPI0027DA22DC|nr:chromatin remodeling protein EBS isoform X2 [Cryptomeria japonica]
MTRAKKEALDYCTIKGNGKVVKVGDTVLMRAQDPDNPPYVARVEKIESEARSNGHVRVRVRWYYRPEESIGGRRPFHGVKELFLSDHYDTQIADTIEDKCVVHSFKNYTKLDSVGAEDYFCRFEYKAATGAFTPDRVAVYCKCEMPYNPDDLMVQCELCKDWFHPACMNLNTEQAKAMEYFYCPDCTDGDKKQGNPAKDFSVAKKFINIPEGDVWESSMLDLIYSKKIDGERTIKTTFDDVFSKRAIKIVKIL